MATEFHEEQLYDRGGPPVAGYDTESVGNLFRDFLSNGQRLFREEVRLARAELKNEARTAGKASGTAVAGGIVAHVGLLALTGALIAIFDTFLPLWLSALLVGAAFALVGGLVAKKGLEKLKTMEKKPRETTETLQEDRQWASETMRAVRSRTRANA
jgi:hypothetical protein